MIRGILLAAGASRRMGCDKLRLPWRGATVLSATLSRWTAVQALEEILLVQRPQSPPEHWSRVRPLVNPAAEEGLGSSLRIGAAALPPDTEAVVIGLADMPEIASATIAALVAAWRPHGPRGIIAPVFDGHRGHPVVFGASHIPALRTLGGPGGGRAIVHAHPSDLWLVAVDDPGVLLDLDTPADLVVPP